MAFPTTGILDNFNRSNEGPPPSANWGECFGGIVGEWKVVSNQCVVDSLTNGIAINYWSASTFGPDTECHCKIVTKPPDNEGRYIVLFVRGTGHTGDGSNFDGYEVAFFPADDDLSMIFRIDNTVGTQLGETIWQDIENGDSIGIEIIGTSNNIKAYYKPASGAWTQMGSTQSDGTYTGAGALLLSTNRAESVVDDFGGGTVAAGAALLYKPNIYSHILVR